MCWPFWKHQTPKEPPEDTDDEIWEEEEAIAIWEEEEEEL